MAFTVTHGGRQALYVPRSEWGARPPKRRALISSTPEGLFSHWGVTPRPQTLEQAYEICRQIQRTHMDVRDWSDGAYSLFSTGIPGVGPVILEMRGIGVAGGHTRRYNSRSHAVCRLAGHPYPPGDGMNDDEEVAFWVARAMTADSSFAVDPTRPHSDVSSTACPGGGAPENGWREWWAAGHPLAGGTAPAPAPQPPLVAPPADLKDLRWHWRPPQTRNLRRKSPRQRGADVWEFQFLANFVVKHQHDWTAVDGIFGDDTLRITRKVQELGRAFVDPNMEVDGIAGPATGHVVVVSINTQGYW